MSDTTNQQTDDNNQSNSQSNSKSGTVQQNDFFTNLMSNPKSMSGAFTGPTFDYWKDVKSPDAMGMGIAGSIDTLENDVDGLFNYIKVLITGGGDGSYSDGPMGNRFFLQTGGTCKTNDTDEVVPRYLYVNNIPTGNIPFISQAAGEDFDTFEGLLPGILQDLEALDPLRIFGAFKQGVEPPCRKIKMETTPTKGNKYKTEQEEYVIDFDIRYIDPCLFNLMGDKNPVTREPCREGFNTRGGIQKHPTNKHRSIPATGKLDMSEALFYFIIGCLILFIVYKLVEKSMK